MRRPKIWLEDVLPIQKKRKVNKMFPHYNFGPLCHVDATKMWLNDLSHKFHIYKKTTF